MGGKISKKNPFVIYNIFPRLLGKMSIWGSHMQRAKDMGFTWIYINPLSYPGFSGSLYSVKDYYKVNPLFLDDSSKSEDDQLKDMIKEAHSMGLNVMFDFVINHTAIDSVLTESHPDWYLRGPRGGIKRPEVWEGDKLVATWGDLGEIDNKNSVDRDNLWQYWKDLLDYYLSLGVDGFRCDAAYQVLPELWTKLISHCKKKSKKIMFFAETLGCEIELVVALAEAGFDFTFNSSKWWDFREEWCLSQYRENAPLAPSIAFAESHDTLRLAKELDNNEAAIKMRYLFSVIYSTSVMMPIGFEYGFRRKPDVVNTSPDNWEDINIDLSSFIAKANQLKYRYQVFNEDNDITLVNLNNENVFAMIKTSRDCKEKVLIIINKSLGVHRHINIKLSEILASDLSIIQDLSIEYAMDSIPTVLDYSLRPAQVMIFYVKN
ncbi:MAG: hypothetical protein A2Y40_07180 [Candidatus Margulisbacteria bacterium GWF2_35_9]|nr:MAG: hypothetical protein A2Y40_07180 [Candidatus Margulisbacteria bacterium GWF2_35_9]